MGSSEIHSDKNLTHLNSSSEVLSKEMAATELLGFWGRICVLAVGSTIVLVSIVIVTCLVRQRCWLHSILFRGGNRDKRKLKTFEKEKLFGSEPPLISYKTADTFVQTATPNGGALPPQKENFFQSSMRRLTPPFTAHQNVGENNSLLGSLSTKRDSTYSSMSENSGRTSPSNSCKSSVEGSMCSAGGSNIGSPTVGDAQGQISFGIQFVLTNEERGAGRLIINVGEARGLQGRQYMGGACDPYLKVIVWKERRSLRKLKTSPLHVYRTRTVRHTTEPSFNETFITEINKSELRDLTVKIVAMDSDKWVSPTTLGEVIQPLRDIKTLATNPEKTTLNYFLAPAKMEIGEILFGLSYLPTAQRLSVSVIKAAHLKYSNIVEDINNFCPYVRALLISPSGRVLRKKKTTFRTNTDKPVWNETLIFDMPQNFVDNVTFILAVCSRPPPSTNESSSEAIINAEIEENLSLCPPPLKAQGNGASPAHEPYRKHDKYIGKVVLGCNVSGEEESKHWMAVLSAPRKVASQWHSLK